MDFNTRVPQPRTETHRDIELGWEHDIDAETGDVVLRLDPDGNPIPKVFRVCVAPTPAEVLRRVNVVPHELLALGGFEGYAAITNAVVGGDVIKAALEDRTVHPADVDRLIGYLMDCYGLFDLLGLNDAAAAPAAEPEEDAADPLDRETDGDPSGPPSQDGKDAAGT